MSLGWIIAAIGAVVLGWIIIAIVTDGRYFGRGVSQWLYDQLGAKIFSLNSESARWQALAKAIPLRGDETMLDVGTAIGDLPLSLAAMPGFSGKIFGIDRSAPMIGAARKAALTRTGGQHIQFQVVDVSDGLPFDDHMFTVIFCMGLLETVSQPEILLRELVRVLATDGKLVLSLYKGWSATTAALTFDWFETHLRPLGASLRVEPCRRSQDVIIVQMHQSC